MSDRQIADWLVETYLLFGGSTSYAYQVAGLFIKALEQNRAAKEQSEGAR